MSLQFIELFLYMSFQHYLWIFVILYILAHFCYIYYFLENGVAFPYFSMIPFVRVLHYRALSGLSIPVMVFYVLATIGAYMLPSLLFWIVWLAASVLLEYKYASVCADCNPWLYALIPPYKLFYLFKEARNVEN